MSKHRIKSVAVEDDYSDGYDDDEYEDLGYQGGEAQEGDAGDESVSAEDREKLQSGTVQVRAALGDQSSHFADKEIQDTLWHYYYDVAKSISYLKNKHGPKSYSQQATQSPGHSKPACLMQSQDEAGFLQYPEQAGIYHTARTPSNHFFRDAPWLNIPSYRRAEILLEPQFPRVGLLGGSSQGEAKMSKLAALAAKRRKVEEKKQQPPPASQEPSKDDTITSLRKLRLSNESAASRAEGQSLRSRKFSGLHQEPAQIPDVTSSENKLLATRQRSGDRVGESLDSRGEQSGVADVGDLQAAPSAFARILLDPCHCASARSLQPTTHLEPSFPSSFDFSKPSPDDVVLKAQNWKGSKTTTPAKQQILSTTKPSLPTGMKDLSIVEAPKIKSKHLDVPAEYLKAKRKNAANFVVIGHVDSGKSTLMGRLLFDLKAIDERTMAQYRKEAERIGKGSFAFAWILDQGTEERARGVTIDVATNIFETEQTSFTILDAPGHRDFVPKMIAGASEADFAVLVIDASPGEFEAGLQGQTKEHVLLVRSMGCSRLIVAVNKMDRIEWSREQFQDIQQQTLAFCTTAGFKKDNVSFVPCSGLHGDNILTKSISAKAGWYSGLTLVEELDKSEPVRHRLDKPLRMIVGSVLQESSTSAPSILGRIEAGCLQIGDEIVLMPSGEHASIRSLRISDEPSDWAVAGQNVTLDLTATGEDKVKTGDLVCDSKSAIQNIKSFTAKLLAFDHLMPMPVDIHRGHMHLPGRISKLVAVLDKADGSVTKSKPQVVHPGSTTRVMVQLEEAAPIESGRVALRANGETVAAGFVE